MWTGIKDYKRLLLKKIEKKTSWGKNELHELICDAYVDILEGTLMTKPLDVPVNTYPLEDRLEDAIDQMDDSPF